MSTISSTRVPDIRTRKHNTRSRRRCRVRVPWKPPRTLLYRPNPTRTCLSRNERVYRYALITERTFVLFVFSKKKFQRNRRTYYLEKGNVVSSVRVFRVEPVNLRARYFPARIQGDNYNTHFRFFHLREWRNNPPATFVPPTNRTTRTCVRVRACARVRNKREKYIRKYHAWWIIVNGIAV